MKEFRPYLKLLTTLTLPHKGESSDVKSQIESALNGQANTFLRKNVNIETLRNSGIFFTGHKLATTLAEPFSEILSKGITILDPACGAGDLLLAAAKKLPVSGSLDKTLSLWGTKLYGYDVDPEFIKAAKIRLFLLAQLRLNATSAHCPSLETIFPNIKTADFLKQSLTGKAFGLVLMNPPYHRVNINNAWTTGLTTIASQFVYKCTTELQVGTKLGALLPDVLRTGTRYAKWRSQIGKLSIISNVQIIGKFDPVTDVDVFQLELLIGAAKNTRNPWYSSKRAKEVVSDYFNVKTGPVVPFRDELCGTEHPFIDASVVPAWKTISPGEKTRRFDRTVFKPPFVVVRRTSGPSDKSRAVASIITGTKDVAVENHFLVLQPISGGLRACQKALRVLRNTNTSAWLNKRIRCRHLTVSAIKALPYGENK